MNASHAMIDDYRLHYLQGRWNTNVVQSALAHAQRADLPSIWLDYLDICHAIQGVSPDQWLDVAQRRHHLSLCTPKLILRLHYLLLTPGLMASPDDVNHREYTKQIKGLSHFSLMQLLSDHRINGYLGCRLSHYPQLHTAMQSYSLTPDGYRFPGINKTSLFHQKKARSLASAQVSFRQVFEQTARNRPCIYRIAVVGNSPNIKQSLHGEEIDSADTVIRFNNSLLNNSNRKHCGQRTDVWVMSPATPVNQCPPDAKAIVVSGLHPLTRASFYWKRLAECGMPLSEFPADVWYALVRQFQAPPSAGALLLASLDTLCLPLDIRYYGFTTDLNEAHSTANHHADNKPRSNRHNWQAETDWLSDRIAQCKSLVVTS